MFEYNMQAVIKISEQGMLHLMLGYARLTRSIPTLCFVMHQILLHKACIGVGATAKYYSPCYRCERLDVLSYAPMV
jgi:hypothetical protein